MVTLISGNPGSGKSTLTAELLRRGVRAVDSDEVDGLAAWMTASGEVVGDATLRPTPELLRDCHWGWSAPRLTGLLAELGPDGVLLGIAVNQWEFTERFDRLVLLELDLATQRDRVRLRDPLFREQILAGLPALQSAMIARGAARVDAARPIGEVGDDVVAILTRR